MRATEVSQRCLDSALAPMHALRRQTLLLALESLLAGRRVVLIDLARSWVGAERIRAPLKRLDRLLGNPRLHAEHEFDYGNRLRKVSRGETWIESYRYDAQGRRAYAWDPARGHLLSQYARDGRLLYQRDERVAKQRDQTYLGNSLVAIREQPVAGGAATVLYQHTDALGTPIAVTDANQALAQTSEYEPYGQLLNRTLTDGVGFTGHVQDAATGLTYMQQRYYDSVIGRFLSTDPITPIQKPSTNFNRYTYVQGNPIRYSDPDGRQKRELGRWIGAMIDNKGDFEKAQAQMDRYHQADMALLNGVTDLTAAGPIKDGVEITVDIYNGKKPIGKASGAVAGEVAGQVTEKVLDGKIGAPAAEAVGAVVGKIVGDVSESSVDSATQPDPASRSRNIAGPQTPSQPPQPAVQRPEPDWHREP